MYCAQVRIHTLAFQFFAKSFSQQCLRTRQHSEPVFTNKEKGLGKCSQRAVNKFKTVQLPLTNLKICMVLHSTEIVMLQAANM